MLPSMLLSMLPLTSLMQSALECFDPFVIVKRNVIAKPVKKKFRAMLTSTLLSAWGFYRNSFDSSAYVESNVES